MPRIDSTAQPREARGVVDVAGNREQRGLLVVLVEEREETLHS